jgi:hypothetical protein
MALNLRGKTQVLKEFQNMEADTGESAPVFLSHLKKPMTPYAIWGVVKKYAADAGVEHISPHSFRHTVATRLVRTRRWIWSQQQPSWDTVAWIPPLVTASQMMMIWRRQPRCCNRKSPTRQSRGSHPEQLCAIENQNMPILSCQKSRDRNEPPIIETAIIFLAKIEPGYRLKTKSAHPWTPFGTKSSENLTKPA